MVHFSPWRRIPGKLLLLLMNSFIFVALIFEGYNQGVLGTVSGTPGFISMSGIGKDGVVTNTTKQGGLAAAYYFGAMFGAFIGGKCHTERRNVANLYLPFYRLDRRSIRAQDWRLYWRLSRDSRWRTPGGKHQFQHVHLRPRNHRPRYGIRYDYRPTMDVGVVSSP